MTPSKKYAQIFVLTVLFVGLCFFAFTFAFATQTKNTCSCCAHKVTKVVEATPVTKNQSAYESAQQ